jgi:hypothetical protein
MLPFSALICIPGVIRDAVSACCTDIHTYLTVDVLFLEAVGRCIEVLEISLETV